MPLLQDRSKGGFIGGRGGLAIPVPAYGAELLTNGDFEAGDPPTGWSVRNGATLSSVADPRTGSAGTKALNALRLSAENVADRNISSLVNGGWYIFQAYQRNVDLVSGPYIVIDSFLSTVGTSSTSYVQKLLVGRMGATSTAVRLYCVGSAGQTGRFDDLSFKAITLASMFSTRPQANADYDVSVPVTVVSGTLAGVVARLDSTTSPANYLIAWTNGTDVRLEQCKAGVWSTLRTGTPTYVAGAALRLWVQGTVAKLYYNGAQVGANATVDAAITGTQFGEFNTHPSNVFGACTIVPAV